MDGLKEYSKIEGNTEVLKVLMENLITFGSLPSSGFNIIEP